MTRIEDEAVRFLYKHGELTHSAAHKAVQLLTGNGFTISRAALPPAPQEARNV